MRPHYILTLCLLAAIAGPVHAQENTTDAEEVMDDAIEEMADGVMSEDTMSDEMPEDTTAEDMAEDAMTEEMAEDAMAEEMTEDAMSEEVMEAETPSLEDIAASDPALDVRVNGDGEVDAMVMLSDVLFSFGDASLEPAALDVLRGVAEKLDDVPSIQITGHTDARGDEDFNLVLGQRRADAVRNWLIANTGLAANVITARGVGEADPIAPNLTEAGNDNPEGRALNRRVEFTLPDAG